MSEPKSWTTIVHVVESACDPGEGREKVWQRRGEYAEESDAKRAYAWAIREDFLGLHYRRITEVKQTFVLEGPTKVTHWREDEHE